MTIHPYNNGENVASVSITSSNKMTLESNARLVVPNTTASRIVTDYRSSLLNILMKNTNLSEELIDEKRNKSDSNSKNDSNWLHTSEFTEASRFVQFHTDFDTSMARLKKTVQSLREFLNSSDYELEDDRFGENFSLKQQYFRATLRFIVLICSLKIPSKLGDTTISKISSDLIQCLSLNIQKTLKKIQNATNRNINPNNQMNCNDKNDENKKNMIVNTNATRILEFEKQISSLCQIILHDLIHEINPLIEIQNQVFLLSPTWRAICDISDQLSIYYRNRIDYDNHNDNLRNQHNNSNMSSKSTIVNLEMKLKRSIIVSKNLMEYGISILIMHIQDGEENLKKHMKNVFNISTFNTPSSSSCSIKSEEEAKRMENQLEFQRKMLTFFLARLGSLLCSLMFTVSTPIYNDVTEKLMMEDVMQSLSNLRGIGVGVKILVNIEMGKSNKSADNFNSDFLSRFRKKYCEKVADIGHKVDQTFLKFVLHTQLANNKNHINLVRTASDLSFYQVALNKLCSFANDDKSECKFHHQHIEKHHAYPNYHSFVPLGKLLLQQTVLKKFLQIMMWTASEKSEIDDEYLFFEKEIFRLCQTISRTSIPQCHWILSQYIDGCCATVTNIFTTTIHLFVDSTLMYNMIKDHDTKSRMMINTHRWIANWFRSKCYKCGEFTLFNDFYNEHPLVQEIIFSTVSIHFLHLHFASKNENNILRISRDSSRSGIIHLISLFTKLIFDPRTSANHSNNLARVLIRIDSLNILKDEAGHSYFQTIIWTIVLNFLINLSGGESHWVQNGTKLIKMKKHTLATLALFLEKMPSYLIWSNSTIASDLRRYCAEILVKNQSEVLPFEGNERTLCSCVIMMYLLNATVRNNQTSENNLESDFHQKTGANLSLFHEAILSVMNRNSERLVPLTFCISVLRFIRYLLIAFGPSYTICSIHKLCHNITMVTENHVETLSQSRTDLQHFIVLSQWIENASILSQMRGIITLSCPAASLEVLIASFQSVLQCDFWPVIADSLTSLETFATNLTSEHGWIIMKILPKQDQSWFQCRLIGDVWGKPEDENDDKEKLFEHKMLVDLSSEKFILQAMYKPLRDNISSCRTICKGHQILQLSNGNPEGPLLILPPNQKFRKEDWEEIGMKMGFLTAKENTPKKEKNLNWQDVEDLHWVENRRGCSLLLSKHK